jgi:hypothetical protein
MAGRGELTEEAWGAIALPLPSCSGRCALVWPFGTILDEPHMIRQTGPSRSQRVPIPNDILPLSRYQPRN